MGGGLIAGVGRLEIRQVRAARPQLLCRRAQAAKDAKELVNLCAQRCVWSGRELSRARSRSSTHRSRQETAACAQATARGPRDD